MVLNKKFLWSTIDTFVCKVSLTKTPTGKYFVSVFTIEDYQELAPANKAVGVDLGLKDLLITSDGEVFKNSVIK